MARVWFVQRKGMRWLAPGGIPAYEAPLTQLIFKLDVGWQRRLDAACVPVPLSNVPSPDPTSLERVFVEVTAPDLREIPYTGYEVGWYDSPYTPGAVIRRLGPPSWASRASDASPKAA